MPQDNKIKIRRGLNSSLPAANTEVGELRYSTDTKELYIDDGTNNVKIGGNPLGFPVSTATQTALDLKANLESPALTGTPTAPTASAGTNTTQIATTAFTLANRGDRYLTTSTSSHSITTGSKTFTVQSGLSYTGTQDVTIVYDGDPTNKHMHGVVTSYSGTTLVVNVESIEGSGGPFTAWTINVGGLLTAQGALLEANNLSDVANPATALTNIGGVPTSRTISSGTGLTGGGDLTANRTLAVSYGSSNPAALGTASAGASNDVSRADHVHSAEVSDSAFRVLGSTDATKKIAIEVDTNVPSGQTVTLTAPSSSGTLALAGDAPAAHSSSHHTGGTDAIAPSNIGAAWAQVLSNQTITGNTLLAAGRNRRITLFAVGATANVDLPHQNNQAGDLVTLVADWSVASTLTIRRAIVMSGSSPVAYSTLATLNAAGQSFTFVSDGTETGWSLRAVDTHAHAASAITSGVLDNARINFAAPPAIGSTTPAAGSFTTLNANNGTLTASAPALTVQQTWNDSAANFVGASIEITNTNNTNNSSSAFRVRVGGTDAIRVDRFRDVIFGANMQMGGASSAQVGQLRLSGFVNMISPSVGVIDMREGASPCDFRIYGQYTSASNFERLSLKYNSTALAFQIGTEKGTGSPSGTARPLEFQTDGVTRMTIGTTGVISVSNIVDIGNTTRIGTTGVQVDAGSSFRFSAGTIGSSSDLFITRSGNGILTVAGSSGSFDRLQFGGTTNLYPALKRSSTTLQVRLANDSDFAPFTAGLITATGNLVLTDNDGAQTATFDAQSKLTANRTYNLPNASGTIALTSDIPSGGSKTYAVFTAEHNHPPSTNFMTLDTRNGIAVLDADDATDESAVFVGIIPEAASLGSGLKIRLHWMATSATSGNVVWDVSLERMNTDLDSDSFDTIASGTAAANGTSGILTVTEITLTTIDSVTAGDGYRLKVTRDANNASDTMTGDAELVAVEVRSAA